MRNKVAKWYRNILDKTPDSYQIRNRCLKHVGHPGTIQLDPRCFKAKYRRLKQAH